MKNILKITFVIIGSLIGAGFASGQEIYIFFYSHGIYGLVGILISSILIGVIINKSLKIILNNDIVTYREFLDVIIKKKNNFKGLINITINAFILVTFFIMIAGFGAYFEQQLGINKIIGSILLSLLCYIVFLKSINGVVKVNEIIVPILIIFIVYIGIKMLGVVNILEIRKYTLNLTGNNYMYILESILYSSYNSILLIPVMITLKQYVKERRTIKYISFLTIIIVSVLAMIIYIILSKVDVNIQNLEMPAVYTVSKLSKILSAIYGFIILSSIFTTAISLGNSFLQNIAKNKKSYQQKAAIMCITSVIISQIGFSNLVNILYPIFGYLGLIQIYKILTNSNITKR